MFLRKVTCSDLWVTSHDKASDFYLSAWQRGRSPLPQLAVRAGLAVAAAGVLAWSLAGRTSPLWLTYLTNWGLVLVAGAALAGLLVSCLAAYNMPAEDALPGPAVALYWLLFNLAQPTALAVTVLYWLLLYDPETAVYPSAEAAARDVATHAFNSVLTLAELATSRTPARALHAWQPLLLALLYIAFSAIYQGTGAAAIYPVLDWGEGAAAAGAVAGGALAGVLALHGAVCLLARARTAAARAVLRLRVRVRASGAPHRPPGEPYWHERHPEPDPAGKQAGP